MKRIALLGCLAALTAAAFADEVKTLSPDDLAILKKDVKTLTPEERAKRVEAAKLRALIENGGRMCYPGTPSGRIAIANLQKRVPTDGLQKIRSAFISLMGYDLALADQEIKGEIIIRIVDKPGAPSLTVWPDDSQAEVNVAALAKDNPKPAFLAARTRKEVLRAFSCMTAGTTYDLALFNKIKSVKDLDDVAVEMFPVDIIMRTMSYMKSAGIEPARRTTYRAVLEDGYDIAPTNGYQKAIYEEVKKTTKLTKKLP